MRLAASDTLAVPYSKRVHLRGTSPLSAKTGGNIR